MNNIAILIDRRISQICKKQGGIISELLGKDIVPTKVEKVITIKNFIGNNLISILREDKKSGSKPKSYDIKIGRLLNEIYPIIKGENVSSSIIEKISKELIAILDKGNSIRMISGKDILYWYNQLNYVYPGSGSSDVKGTLSKSCMRYPAAQSYLKVYEENSDKISMLIKLDENDKLLARALVWKLDDGKVLLDRVYYTDESEASFFINYAKKNNWLYYDTFAQNSNNKGRIINIDGKVLETPLITSLNKVDFSKYPYLDVFRYFHPLEKKWSNFPDKKSKWCLRLDSTGGGYNTNNIDNNYQITDEEFDNVKKLLNSDKLFNISKLSIAKKIEYGTLLGDPWKLISNHKWTNNEELFEILDIVKDKNIKGNLILHDCDIKYIVRVINTISKNKNNNINYKLSEKSKAKIEDVVNLFMDDTNSLDALLFLICIISEYENKPLEILLINRIKEFIESGKDKKELIKKLSYFSMEWLYKNILVNFIDLEKDIIKLIIERLDSYKDEDESDIKINDILNLSFFLKKDDFNIQEEYKLYWVDKKSYISKLKKAFK